MKDTIPYASPEGKARKRKREKNKPSESTARNPKKTKTMKTTSERQRVEVEQGYCIVPSQKKFILLYSFLMVNRSKKGIVFFSSSSAVKFYSDLLRYVDNVDCLDIHGKQTQQKNTAAFFDFCKADKGVLLCTGEAARGLDFPAVDLIVQFDPPDEPEVYVRRLRQAARGEGRKGKALLFLIPEELQFIHYLMAADVILQPWRFEVNKLKNVQSKLEKMVARNYALLKSAKEAYTSYLLAYNSHPMKDIFSVHRLNLQAVATSFCFSKPPKVNLT